MEYALILPKHLKQSLFSIFPVLLLVKVISSQGRMTSSLSPGLFSSTKKEIESPVQGEQKNVNVLVDSIREKECVR